MFTLNSLTVFMIFFFNLFLVAKEIKYLTLNHTDDKENVESKSAVPRGPHVTPYALSALA